MRVKKQTLNLLVDLDSDHEHDGFSHLDKAEVVQHLVPGRSGQVQLEGVQTEASVERLPLLNELAEVNGYPGNTSKFLSRKLFCPVKKDR